METQNKLESCLQIWKEVYATGTKRDGEIGDHLSMAEIYRMASPNGIKRADAEAVNHLSL